MKLIFFCHFYFLLTKFLFFLQVKVSDGWVKMADCGTTLLPCLFCLATHEATDWKTVEMQPAQLHTHLDKRLRQHLKRHHKLRSRDDKAEEMKSRARIVLCGLLHKQPSRQPFEPQVGLSLFVSYF